MSAQRRIVTVLFADVVGSTAIGEALDPEDLGDLLATYYRTAREVIETYGGTIEKFIGDAVMAVFGVPLAHDDDAGRAIAAGLDLRERVRTDASLGARLPIRIGINTGEVATRAGDAGEQSFIAGDAVNVAARLQQQAEPWSILVGERTANAAAAAFSFGPPMRIAPRGRSASVEAREVLAERALSASPTPFVGRDGDLEQLRLVARRAFAEHRPWLVSIVAPPGTGKSRLLGEFLESLSGDAVKPAVVVARCLPYGEQLAYQPLRAVIDGIVDAPVDAGAEELLAALERWLRQAAVAQPERVAELLAATVGVTTAPTPLEASELFAAWRAFLEGAARRGPIVLAIEDLHWASDSLLELIDFALQPHANVPALLMATARPDLFDRRAVWSGGRRNHTTIDLAPLDNASVERIVEHLLPDAIPATVASVVARADGNPFFALEIARSVTERPAASELPDTVQATIQARLDRLVPTDRRVMEVGAVFGRSFTIEGVSALTGLPPTSVVASGDRLIERGLLVPAGDGELAASHILIRDVAYGGLSRADRAVLHYAAANWLAGLPGTGEAPSAELIAVHYREAALLAAKLDATPPELAGVREEAVAWLRRAAERAIAAAASADAVSHLQAALEIAPEDERSSLFERVGDTNVSAQAAVVAYRRALELARARGVDADEGLRLVGKLVLRATRESGGVADQLSLAEMTELLDAGEELARSTTDELALARYLVGRAFVPFWTGPAIDEAARDAARADAHRGLELAERHDDANLQSAALDALGSLSETWQIGLGHARQRMAIAGRLELSERIDAHSTAAWAACITGDLALADEITAAGMALLEPGQVPSYALHLVAWRICALRQLGRWGELDALGQTAVEIWETTGRSAAGFATRGFADLLEVCRARLDDAGAARFGAVLTAIYDQYPSETGFRRNEVLLDPRPEILGAYLADREQIAQHIRVYGQIDGYERVTSRFLDEGGRLDPDAWRELADASERIDCRIMAAQALRAVGLATSSAAELVTALEIAESTRARPLAARLMVELGRERGEDSLLRNGVELLRELGDLEHLSRVRDAR